MAAAVSFDTDPALGTFAKLNTWQAQFGAGTPRPEVQFSAKAYSLDAPIDLRSGMKLIGTRNPAREFGTGTVFRSGNAASFFRQVANSQGYPSDGSARDVGIQGIQFYGSVPVLPKNDLAGSYSGKTWWYFDFRDCGFVISDAIAQGWGDGLSFSGITHVQGCSKASPFYFGGSENNFTSTGISFLDSGDATWTSSNKPFFNMFSTLWTLGDCMISAELNSYHVLVSGGGNGRISRVYFDANDSTKTAGAQLRVTGGSGPLSVSDCSFHNGGGISLTGGSSDVTIQSCAFDTQSGGIVVGPGFNGRLLLGLNGYLNAPKGVKVARQAQIPGVSWSSATAGKLITDPAVTVSVG